MMDVRDALWQQVEPIVFITKDQFMAGLAEWEIEPVEIDGTLAFAALQRGSEFHFSSFGSGARISMPMIKSRLDSIMAVHGCVTTRTPKDDADRQHRINRKLGFVVTHQDEFFTHYRMEAAPCR